MWIVINDNGWGRDVRWNMKIGDKRVQSEESGFYKSSRAGINLAHLINGNKRSMWLEWEGVETDKIRELGRGHIRKGLVGQYEECGFYSNYSASH